MSEAMHEKPMSPSPLSNPVAEMVARNADQWLATQAALLADVDALTHAWLHRRREGVDAMQQAIQQMTGCRDPGEMLRIQQEWLSGMFRRATEDIAAFNTSISSITIRATTDLERAAREITEPVRAVSEEEPKAAGVKAHQRKSAA
ncbi:MAG: phasin family protein [Stellaceae bacterium]